MNNVVPSFEIPTVPVHGGDDRFPVRHIYCVGRNYAEHAKEMGGDATKEPPFFFTKAADSVVPVVPPAVGSIAYPLATKNFHHEIELVVAIGGRGAILPVPVGHVGHARLHRLVGSIIAVSGPPAGRSAR
jgi:fumarylpyruvate hydrolase